MNKNIYEQPLVLFLGAGASKPLGLMTTPEFWEWFKYSSGFNFDFLNAIADAVEPSEEIGRKPDVEAVLDILEKVNEGWQLESKIHRHRRPPVEFLAEEFETRLSEVSEKMKNMVVEHYSKVDKQKAFELYRPLLELAIGQPLPVFTTNYDLAIEKAYEFTVTPSYELSIAPFNLQDGFSRERIVTPEWSRSAYDGYSPTGADVMLFKLHGSVDWVRTPTGAIQRVESRKRDPGEMKTIIAYPSRLKREIHQEPFRTNYDYLLACLLHAKVCAVIGFSFRDQEIVEEFRQAMQLNKKLKLMIIDPNAEAIGFALSNKLNLGAGKVITITIISEEFTLENAESIADRIAAKIKR